MKRQRGRGRRSGGGNNNSNNPNRHYESNGPDVKIRGSAQQILDKYLQYARDAQTSGDRINAEAYYQYAEHYFRVIAAMQPKQKPQKDGEATDANIPGEATTEAKTEGADTGETSDARPHEDRPRRERSRKDKPEETVDADASTTEDSPAEEEASGEESEEPAKPKRRRTYKRRDAEAEETTASADDSGDDGVMKTLSRGRRSDEPAADGDDTPVEAAE